MYFKQSLPFSFKVLYLFAFVITFIAETTRGYDVGFGQMNDFNFGFFKFLSVFHDIVPFKKFYRSSNAEARCNAGRFIQI